MLLEVTFGKLYAWAIQNVRNILLDASAKFKELGESHFVAVGWGENCFKLILLHFFKVPNNWFVLGITLTSCVSMCCSTLTPLNSLSVFKRVLLVSQQQLIDYSLLTFCC